MACRSLRGVGMILVLGASLAWPAAGQVVAPRGAPRIEHGWEQLPAWAETGLPFDARPYFAIPDSENSAPLYLQAYLAFDLQGASCFFEGIEQEPGFEAAVKASQARLQRLDELYERCTNRYRSRLRIGPEDRPTATAIVAEFQDGLQKLEEAQLRPRCFFHPNIDISDFSPQSDPRGVFTVLGIRTQVELGSGSECRNARIGLRLVRDLQSLECPTSIGGLQRKEQLILADWVWSILEQPRLSTEALRELVAVLQEHYLAQQEFDPCVAGARYEYLMWRSLFEQLQNGKYAKSADERSKNLGLKTTPPVPVLLVREVTAFEYDVNSLALDEFILAQAKRNPAMERAGQALAEARAETAKLSPAEQFLKGNDTELAGVAPLVAQAIATMSPDENAAEVRLLDARYQQIVAAARQPFPQSTAELKVLCKQWTADEAWRQTRLLRWFQPQQYHYTARWQAVLMRNAIVCLTAALAWSRDHGGQIPDNLSEVMAGLGLAQVPVDPFSGEPLKLTTIDGQLAVYSVGPDGDDDGGTKPLDVFHGGPGLIAKIPPDGDVVFRLGAEPGAGVLR